MKNYFYFLSALILFCFTNNYSQNEPATCGTISTTRHLAKKTDFTNRGGIYIPSAGTLRVLVVFVQFKDDNDSNPHWTSGQGPDYMNSFIDANQQQGSSNYINLTNYFNQMSLGTYHIIGNAIYVQTQENRSYYFDPNNYGTTNPRYFANKMVLQQKVDPLINFANYDNWQYNSDYNFRNQADNIVDMIIMVWRGLQFDGGYWLGEASLGDVEKNLPDYTVESGNKTIKSRFGGGIGSGITVQDWGARSSEYNFHSVIHELAHWLIGPVHPYCDNIYCNPDEHEFWGMLHHSADGICSNAYESDKLNWVTPTEITGEISDATLSDFITTGSAYKYHPTNGAANEYYYFENHQQLSIYDNATRNTNDKGIFVIQMQDEYNGTNNVKCRTSNGDWTWENPFYTSACFSTYLPAFRMQSANRYGLNTRDILLPTGGGYQAIFAIADVNNNVSCNGYEYGEGSNGAFNTTYNKVFAPWTNPSSHTWDNQDTNFEMQVTSQNGNSIHVHFYSGNMAITENTTLSSGSWYFNGNVSINTNVTLTISPGATLYFTNGASLIVNGYGTLTANGTLSQPITFDFGSPNFSTQNGIIFNVNSMGTINYCKIRNAWRGIYENNWTIDLTNSAFSGCYNGLYLYISSPTIRYCNFHDNANAGIYLIYSSPVLYNNYMQNNYYGVYCTTSSNPLFGNGTTYGLNGTTNYCGVYCYNNSLPVIGKTSPQTGGYNNLVNAAYNVYNASSGTVYANHIWWGDTQPANFKISGTTSYSDYLTSGVTISPAPPLSKVNTGLTSSGSNDIPMLANLNKAYQLMADNNLAEARTVCLDLVNNYPDYSVSYNALNLLKETYSKNELTSQKDLYNSLYSKKGKKDLYAMAGLILSDIDKDNKLKQLNDVINNYAGESVIELALFDKFIYYYFDQNDKANARTTSDELDKQFPQSAGAFEAHKILGDKEYIGIYADNFNLKKTTTNTTPIDFALVGNYPNPFNPSTTISYSIPEDGKVTVKVFDVLGRELATLVNDVISAGAHSVLWNGNNFASGIYFYSVTFKNQTLYKKMLLVK